MPIIPTAWNNLPAPLQILFNDIICAPGSNIAPILNDAITNPSQKKDFTDTHAHGNAAGIYDDPNFLDCCWDFVDYQRTMCTKAETTLNAEGFQIGSPWHGDVMQAPVLFLSINPAITQYCVFPRWHPAAGIFTLGGENADGGTAFNVNCGGTISPNVIAAPAGVYDFLRDRLRLAQTTANGGPYAWKIDAAAKNANAAVNTAQPFYVSYWGKLLPPVMNMFHPNIAGLPAQTHTQNLMNSVLSSEIIFWGSKNAIGTRKIGTLMYFWDKFVVPLLTNCGASLLFLVGADTLRTFNRILKKLRKGITLTNGNIYDGTSIAGLFGGKVFQIAAIDHPDRRLIAAHPALNYQAVVNKLDGTVPDPQRNAAVMANVAAQINALY